MRSTQSLSIVLFLFSLAPRCLAAPAPVPVPQDLFAGFEEQFQQLANQLKGSGGSGTSASSFSTGDQTFSQVSDGTRTVTDTGPGSSTASLGKRFLTREKIQAYIDSVRAMIEEEAKGTTVGDVTSTSNNTDAAISRGPGNVNTTSGGPGGTQNEIGGQTSAFASNGTDDVTSSGPGDNSASIGEANLNGQGNGQGNNGEGNGQGNGQGNNGEENGQGNGQGNGDGNGGSSTFSFASNGQDTVTDSGPGSSSASVGLRRRFMG